MAFKLKSGRSVRKRLRRVVGERIDKAMEELRGQGGSPSDEGIHQARRRLKQIRGTLRLARDSLGERTYRSENRVFRDAGRPLSLVRDAKISVDTLDKLVDHFGLSAGSEEVSQLRELLLERQRAVRQEVIEHNGTVETLLTELGAAKARIEGWPLRWRGWKAIGGGLGRAYRQARRAMDRARADATDEALHEWRKRTQDLRYTLELLESAWRQTLEPLAQEVKRLSDLLGDDHDLMVLGEVASRAGKDGRIAEKVAQRRSELRSEAFALGAKLYIEDEDSFARRIKKYWKASSRAPGDQSDQGRAQDSSHA
jgi:CHAD domain-containing protein